MISDRNRRITRNTIMLYLRQLLILFVSLYTVRVVLDQLGVVDYGIYSVIGGLVALSAFLPYSLAQATQRFIAFALGENDLERLKRTFSVNLVLYAVIAFVSFVVLQSAGLWFVKNQLSLPDERYVSALNLFQYSALTFLVSVITSPFIAVIMAHEDMKFLAYISIFEALMKLAAVFFLQIIPQDKLEFYGLAILIASLVNATLYIITCVYRYDECQLRKFYWDFRLLKEIIAFTGWTIFGAMSTIVRTHAITILLNQSFNPTVVAARTISVQIASQISSLSVNFNSSISPPIIKAYAADQHAEMHDLIIGGSKITFFLLWVLALPLIIEMELIIRIWLVSVPKDAVLFSQLAIVEALILSISLPLTAAARAPGKMKAYEIILGSIQIAIFITSWIVISNGAAAYSVFVVAIYANILMFAVRLFLVKLLTGLPITNFLRHTVLPAAIVVLLTYIPIYVLNELMKETIYNSAIIIITSVFLSTITMYRVGLDENMRGKVLTAVKLRLRDFVR